jgi:DNA ligase (NAD+)
VYLGGVTVSSISIHNEEYIKEKQLQIGDAVLIERAGDVIPQIVKSIVEARTGNEEQLFFQHNVLFAIANYLKKKVKLFGVALILNVKHKWLKK